MQMVSDVLSRCNFAAAIATGTETHRQGNHLDQVYARNIDIVAAGVSDGYDEEISDHKCLKVTLRLKQH